MRNFHGIVLHHRKHIRRFSNLHLRTFKTPITLSYSRQHSSLYLIPQV